MHGGREMAIELNGRLKKSILLLGDLKNKKILNVGCKGSWLEQYLSNNKVKIKEMYSFDIQDYDFPSLGKKFHFSIDSALDMQKYFNKNFDIVTFFEVIEHIPKNTEIEALKNINKSLKIGGTLYLSTPYKSIFSIIFDPAYWLIGHRHYSFEELNSFFEKAGFKVVKYELKGGFHEIFGMLFYYIFKHIFRSKKIGLNLFERSKEREFLDENYTGFTNIFIVGEKIMEAEK